MRGTLYLIFDSWAGVTLLFALVAALSLPRVTRPYVSGFLLPVLLLFLRKALLYYPVAGTISTEDRLIFWSTGAYISSIIYLLSVACIVLWVVMADSRSNLSTAQAAVGGAGLIGLLLGVLCLGKFGGWSFYMVPLSVVGLCKLLIASPLLLPLVGVAVIIHLWRVFSANLLLSREINKALLLFVLAAGVMQLGAGAGHLSQARDLLKFQETWPWEEKVSAATNEFADIWIKNLKNINRCGVNIIHANADISNPECKIREIVRAIPSFDISEAISALGVATILILATIAVERRAGEEEDHVIVGQY